MPKPDIGHERTDELLDQLERRIASIYRTASKEIQEKIDAYFESFAKRDAEMKALIGKEVNGKEWTEQDYKQWRLAQIGRGERFEALRDQLAERMTQANTVAATYINDSTPEIYSLNRNYAAYTIEQINGNVGFTLWDESTVKRLIKDAPDLMPYYPPQRALKRGIDLAWGKKQITSQITQSILQGEGIMKMADRLQKNIPTMNRNSAIRAARTAATGAQNAGRMDSYAEAEKMGIKNRIRWIATKDSDTRKSHRKLDGEIVNRGEKFSNGCRFPGDPRGKPEEIYNCRCRIRTVEKDGIEAEPRQMRVETPEYTKALELEKKAERKLKNIQKQIENEKDENKLTKLKKQEREAKKQLSSLRKKRKETTRTVVVNEMTYSEWEEWVKSR